METIDTTLELTRQNAAALAPLTGTGLPALPWRDPHNVPLEERRSMIQRLETACAENPASADLRTCLALVHAVNYDPQQVLVSLEKALELEPKHFFAQLKLAELWYRLRALPKAEEEALKALDLAQNAREYQMARAQLQEIRKLINNSWARPTWNKSMASGAWSFVALIVVMMVVGLWR